MSASPIRRICVFCGARSGASPAFEVITRQAAAAIAARGMSIVYGGGNVGLMGALADAALDLNVHITGVIPRSMVDVELAHTRIQRLIVVETMHERKAVMARESDAVLVLPGGVGTLDELFEAMTWNQLRIQRKPIGLVDVPVSGGTFYAGLLGFIDTARAHGLILGPTLDLFTTGDDPGALLDRMAALAGHHVAPLDRTAAARSPHQP